MSTRNRTYLVKGMNCGHCRASVSEELAEVEGVDGVEIDLASGRVEVNGGSFRDEDVEAAVEEAGYRMADAR